jgi:glycosyltransferase involved in cell wall biosynthesis
MTGANRTIKMLRVGGVSSNISANVFEDLFRRNIGSLFQTDYMSCREFAIRYSGQTGSPEDLNTYDYLCLDYLMMAAAPWVMQLRNRNLLSFGMLFITHSPGLYGLEWHLMRELIRPKDIIIAPSGFSAGVISLLAPSLSSNVEIISHPMDLESNPLEKPSRRNTIVTLSRITEDKLIHRQIDAMALVVHTYGYDHLKMVIGGSLTDSESNEITSYSRLLMFKIKRLRLEHHVRLAGEITAAGKNEFFKNAFVSVNLSRTLEEAFPKASVEALGHGIPVVSTRWNGFCEIVGPAGILIDLALDHGRADLSPDDLARAIVALYENPIPKETCLQQILRYDVQTLRERYRDVVSRHVSRDTETEAGPERVPGLLDTLAFLSVFSHSELMGYHTQWVETFFGTLKTGQPGPTRASELFFRFFITDALKDLLTGFYSYQFTADMIREIAPTGGAPLHNGTGDFREKIRQSIFLADNTHTKKTLLTVFSMRPDPDLLKQAVSRFIETDGDIPARNYFIPFADYLNERHLPVCRFYRGYFRSRPPGLHQGEMLCLWAKAAVKCNDTQDTADYLSRWLTQFMDEPESIPVHIEYLKLLIHAADTPEPLIRSQLDVVNDLCYDRSLARHLEVLAHAG